MNPDLLPEAYVAPRELRDLRDLLRHRVALTQLRSALKNRVHALLAKHGVQHGYADLFGKGGSEFLATLELRELPRRRLESSLSLIGDFDREIEVATGEIDGLAKHDNRVEVLCQLRGMGRYTAMLVIAEVGDISRFGSARKLCAWAGLTPTIRSSDGKARLGHIIKQGSRPLRWALVEAAQHAGRGGGPLRDSFERIAKRRGRKIAKVAVARKILTLCYYGLRDGEIRCLARRCRPSATVFMAASREVRRPPDRRRRRRMRCGYSGELAVCHGLHPQRTAAHLIEPPSTARHSGPPSATGWMTERLRTRPSHAQSRGDQPSELRDRTLTRARSFMDDKRGSRPFRTRGKQASRRGSRRA